MLRDITLGQFFPGSSPIHKLDPRTKILWTLFYVILLFLVDNFVGFLVCGLFILGVIEISGIKLKLIIKGLKPILYLLIFTMILNIFMTRGETVIFSFFIFTATVEGVKIAVLMALRLVLLVMGSSLLTFTTSPIVLTDGLESLISPLSKIGVPSHEIAMMMTIALRFIPTILEETDKIMKAQSARGADFESGNILKRAKAMVPLLVPLFISAFRRADDLAVAMECRCYRGGKGRTRLNTLHFSMTDLYAFLISVALACVVFVTRVVL